LLSKGFWERAVGRARGRGWRPEEVQFSMDFPLYEPDPMLLFVAQGYTPSDERLVDWLLESLRIRVIEG
jgi:hypothetical protein